ncbi:DUF885 family protein [Roseivirga sp. 4D4]|uniref:DUF885 family protein n=1 Tax=Roseivirga sp. 4D4 TaxID=1889784 RepID=UPI001479C494|nr:DUF885 family protein [Roseivirga sp. 4D4]
MVLLGVALFPIQSQAQSAESLDRLLNDYNEFLHIHPPVTLRIDFKTYINALLGEVDVNEQLTFFESIQERLLSIEIKELSNEEQFDHQFLSFESALQIEKCRLIASAGKKKLSTEPKIFDFPQGSIWYQYLVKKWTGSDLSMNQIYNLGLAEIERVKNHIQQLDIKEEIPSSNFTNNRSIIEKSIHAKLSKVETQFGKLLPKFSRMPSLNVARGRNVALAQTPAYYSNNTFYYNLFDKPFNLSDVDFLLIHEGIPGHHYQRNYHSQLYIPEHIALSPSMGFIEGWAAYTENLGWELGLYQTPFEELSKWNWDLIRSARVVMDIGLNYHGWSDDEALSFWKEHIRGQDDIALREINRMKRWPAQVLTYKLGDIAIRQALAIAKTSGDFDYLTFHRKLLSKGPIPVHLMATLMQDII